METLYDRPDVREALRALEAEALQSFTRLLTPRESVVLQGRFIGHPPRRWESLGRAMGISREQVRRLEATIITKFDAWQRPSEP
jgi:DNA-directed RNA polymerase sigma subunit (sigma70/sigma32)